MVIGGDVIIDKFVFDLNFNNVEIVGLNDSYVFVYLFFLFFLQCFVEQQFVVCYVGSFYYYGKEGQGKKGFLDVYDIFG